MQEITVSLSDGQIARLREIAQQLALTPEQAAAELLGEQLTSSGQPQKQMFTRDSPPHSTLPDL